MQTEPGEFEYRIVMNSEVMNSDLRLFFRNKIPGYKAP
jgi:hypothetical protein